MTIVHAAREALAGADAAASRREPPCSRRRCSKCRRVALYVLSDAQAKIARRVYKRRYITLPNLVLDEPVVPELLQEAATPHALADALERALARAGAQLADFRRLRDGARHRPTRCSAARASRCGLAGR